MGAATLIAVGTLAVVLLAGFWLGYQLFLLVGRLALRIEALELQLGQLAGLVAAARGGAQVAPARASGRPIGTVLHDFDLPDLAGRRVTLSQWRGRRLLLLFVSPDCGPSRALLSAIADLPTDLPDGRPLPLIVSTGDAEANRRVVEQHRIGFPVVLQEQMEVGAMYGIDGTPMGYLVDEDGRTASVLTTGARALAELAGLPARSNGRAASLDLVDDRTTPAPDERAPSRDGLAVGTVAPDFALPRVGGGVLTLAEFRGRRVLLVFTDPHCPPCDQLAPHLEPIRRARPDLSVVAISRGDPEANHAMVTRYGLTFPVALQRHWDVSRAYAMLAAPIGYLIDADGVIEAGVAVGVEATLALASRPAQVMAGTAEQSTEGREPLLVEGSGPGPA